MRRCSRILTVALAVVVLVACGSASNDTTGSGAGATSGAKDPCQVLTGLDAKTLFATSSEPSAHKTASPFLSCEYDSGRGPEAMLLAISPTTLTDAKNTVLRGNRRTKTLRGLGDASFVAGGSGAALVAWARNGLTYKLWCCSPGALGQPARDPTSLIGASLVTTPKLIALARTIARR